MIYNEIKLKQLANLLGIEDIEQVEHILKRQSRYLKLKSTSYLLKSYIVIYDIKKEIENKEIAIDKYVSKNLIVNKYKSQIVELYLSGMGYLKISNSLYLNHNAKISKSSIENFIKKNNIKREI